MWLGLQGRLRYHPSPILRLRFLHRWRILRPPRISITDLTRTYNAAENPRTNYWRLGYCLSGADGRPFRLLRRQRLANLKPDVGERLAEVGLLLDGPREAEQLVLDVGGDALGLRDREDRLGVAADLALPRHLALPVPVAAHPGGSPVVAAGRLVDPRRSAVLAPGQNQGRVEQPALVLALAAVARIGWNPYLHNPKLLGRLHFLPGGVEAEVIEVNDVPIAFEGHAPFNIQNAMAAAAAGYALGLTLGDIRMGLQTFHPTPGQLPGRTNLIEADGVRCLIDYGHNVPALVALEPLVEGLASKRRIGVASAPGNRRDEDLMALGAQLAKMNDVLFICESDPRGRKVGGAAELLRRGAVREAGTARATFLTCSQGPYTLGPSTVCEPSSSAAHPLHRPTPVRPTPVKRARKPHCGR